MALLRLERQLLALSEMQPEANRTQHRVDVPRPVFPRVVCGRLSCDRR